MKTRQSTAGSWRTRRNGTRSDDQRTNRRTRQGKQRKLQDGRSTAGGLRSARCRRRQTAYTMNPTARQYTHRTPHTRARTPIHPHTPTSAPTQTRGKRWRQASDRSAVPRMCCTESRMCSTASRMCGVEPRMCGVEPRVCGVEPRVCGAEPRVCGAELRVCGAELRMCSADPGCEAQCPGCATQSPGCAA